MDGIEALFNEFSPINFWDTDNEKEMDESSWENSPYNEDDWKFYKNLRDLNPNSDPIRLALLAGGTLERMVLLVAMVFIFLLQLRNS